MSGERVLGFIPAKGGSERFPRKNIAPLNGRPLITYAIDAARQSGVIDSIAVSSEDDEVLACASQGGVDHALRRPDVLARDPAGIVDVALHELDALERRGEQFDIIVILAPCAPLRTPDDVREAFELFQRKKPNFVMSVSEFTHTPFAALVTNDKGFIEPAFPKYFGRKSQEMPRAFRPNGAIHVLGIDRFRESRDYLAPPLVPYVMPRERAIDVDHREDLELAEVILRNKGSASPALQGKETG